MYIGSGHITSVLREAYRNRGSIIVDAPVFQQFVDVPLLPKCSDLTQWVLQFVIIFRNMNRFPPILLLLWVIGLGQI